LALLGAPAAGVQSDVRALPLKSLMR
jgi:hypothetical protein